MSARSGHIDGFANAHLPPRDQWPVLLLDRPEFTYPERLNAAVEFLDRMVEKGFGPRPCLIGRTSAWTYAETLAQVNRIANVLINDLGFVPGNRVLLRSGNNPMLAACYLAVLKAGGVVVATMPLMRAGELATVIRKAEISHAFCHAPLIDELAAAQPECPTLKCVVAWDKDSPDSLDALMAKASPDFAACDTAQDDTCLIAFTSGTTGVPKGTMHFHRDLLIICDGFGVSFLKARAEDRFIGSPPLAFTFGAGGLLLFPLRIGASTVLLEQVAPKDLLAGIAAYKATTLFTAPTAFRAMLPELKNHDISSLRRCVSAGEVLPAPTWDAWHAATGLKITEGLGSTELLHVFVGGEPDTACAGRTGFPVPGYEARVVDEAGNPVPDGTAGRLAVRGPTGCRYLDDPRQRDYVQDGWNFPGDTYIRHADGQYEYVARSDDMIISAGYNIGGPEVEAALLRHPAVRECGVIGAPDPDRGMIVKAYVVLAPGIAATAETAKLLQDHVKATIAPYKYPRAVVFLPELPKTATGKVQRFVLRQWEKDGR